MRITTPLAILTALLGLVTSHEPLPHGATRELAQSVGRTDIWAGANSYFLHTFQDADRNLVLDAMHAAKLEVVRIFVSDVYANNKGTGCNAVNDVEVGTPGQWDDTVLKRIDQLMVEVHSRGMKLILTLHDRWMLGHWGSDVYVSKYKLQGDDIYGFYANAAAAADMDRRFAHMLTHRNPHFGNRTWGELDEAVFSIGIENESQGAVSKLNFKWVCDRARALRRYILKPSILVSSGGGREIGTSLHPDLLNCDELDILGVHYYGASDSDVLQQVGAAVAANKKRIYVEEFGSLGANKAADLRRQIQTVKSMGVPWMFWQVSKPGKGSGDYEVWTDEPAWQAIKGEAAMPTQQAQAWPELGRDGTIVVPPTSPPATPIKGDWQFCSVSAECQNGCCSKQYSDDGKLKCTPGGSPSQCVVGTSPSPVPTPTTPTPPTTPGKGDWNFCAVSAECLNKCCSKQYSDDGKLKCTPGGSRDQCV
jgi:mannan endo-1,4-beta-mannosidase